jgi:hypothetical protein
MNAAQLRRMLRFAHLFLGAALVIYVYSPLHANPLFTDIIRYLAVPALVLSGVAMWQQGRISRWSVRRSKIAGRA